MDIRKVCISNLGKEVNYDSFKGMVVGEYTDIILLCSPLNRSYALVYPKNYKEQLIL